MVEVAIPVFNEELMLEESTRRLRAYLDESFPFEATIRIVDNASTDATWEIATRLASTLPGVSALRLDQKGKGEPYGPPGHPARPRSLPTWMSISPPTSGPCCRWWRRSSRDTATCRSAAASPRALTSCVALVVKPCRASTASCCGALCGTSSRDATCGFKAARRETAELLLPLVHDDHWFFDTEFLVLAERNGFRIHEVPVDWVDDADSRVNVVGVARDDLRGIARLVRNRATSQGRVAAPGGTGNHLHSSQATRYASVGILSTVAYLAIFFLLRHQLGLFAANVIAMAVSTIGNTIAHVLFTFGPRSGVRMRQAATAGAVGFATGVVITTLVLGLEDLLGVFTASSEVLAILIGIVASAYVRLILLRSSAYRTHTLADDAGLKAAVTGA